MMQALVTVAVCALHVLAAAQDPLDELLGCTNELKSFTALYTITTSKLPKPIRVRVDYVAPARVRVESTLPAYVISQWCVDGVYALTKSGDDDPLHGRADYAAVRAHLDELERTLAGIYPATSERAGTPGAILGLRWWFDEKTLMANCNLEAGWSDERSVAFGWIASLRSKNVVLESDGEHSTFTSDEGSFHGRLSNQTGFLVDLWGKSPNGELHLHLESLERDLEIEAGRFALPPIEGPGRAVSPELERMFIGSATRELRARMYRAIAGAQGEPWTAESRAQTERALRAFQLVAVEDALGQWRANSRKKLEGSVERLRKVAETKTPEELATARKQERGGLMKHLEDLEGDFITRLVLPAGAEGLPRAGELLELEREVLLMVFDETVRQPLKAEFVRVTEPTAK